MTEYRYNGTALTNPLSYGSINVSGVLQRELTAQGLTVTYCVVTPDSRRDSGALDGNAASFGVKSNLPETSVAEKVDYAISRSGIVRHQIVLTGKFGSNSSSSSGSGESLYKVSRGDTLALIAKRFGTTWQTLAAYNSLSNPNALNVGQVLRIPAKGVVVGQVTGSVGVNYPSQVTGSVGVNYPNATTTNNSNSNNSNSNTQQQQKDEADENSKAAWGQSIMTIGLVAVGAYIVIDLLGSRK